jgi:hypothetical protein
MNDELAKAVPPPGPAPVDPRQAVKQPALFLMIAGGINAACCVVMLLLNILGAGLGALASGADAGEQGLNLLSGGMGILAAVIGLGISGLIIYGAMQMKELKNHTLALVAAISAIIPCVSPCCLVGVPAGIYAVVILIKPEVKAAFAKK